MNSPASTALAHPNIAFIKYWGNRDDELRLPANGSLSMTLGGLESRTTVRFDSALATDEIVLNGRPAGTEARGRVSAHLDRVRALAAISAPAAVDSTNSFPTSAGIASSASGFAALTLAACAAASLELDPKQLSQLARRGSGSAARSIFGGYVIWHRGEDDDSSYAEPLAPADHWALRDLIVVVEASTKEHGSSRGHRLAPTSPLQSARVASAPDRLARCRQALLARDFDQLAQVAELDSDMMHAVMMTSTPPLLYWVPASVGVMKRIRDLRQRGLPVFYTLDAGPNVHCLCPAEAADEVRGELAALPGVLDLLTATPGEAARLVNEPPAG